MAKFTKIGVVRLSADPKKQANAFISLGDNYKKKDKKWERHVEIRVTDGNGEEVAYTKNGILSVLDPRKKPSMTQEQIDAVPDWLLKEIVLIENNNEQS